MTSTLHKANIYRNRVRRVENNSRNRKHNSFNYYIKTLPKIPDTDTGKEIDITRTVHHINVLVNGKIADTCVLLDKGGNHATITNKGHVLFDGYILEAYKIWENKMNEYKLFENAGFLNIEVVK